VAWTSALQSASAESPEDIAVIAITKAPGEALAAAMLECVGEA